jgi:hypothetical protein
MSVLASGVAECCGQWVLPRPTSPQEDSVGFFFDEAQPEELLDLEPIDFFGQSKRKASRALMTGKRAALIRRAITRSCRVAASPWMRRPR